MKSYIQPFERRLALEELRALAGAKPTPVQGNPHIFDVESGIPPDKLARNLAYWEVVMADRSYLTTQVLREATASIVRNGIAPEEIQIHLMKHVGAFLPNRRCLRYGTHGLHEYRGKFFPQLVKSLLNTARLRANSVVADPMCGSGTTAIEALLAGHRALAADLNPLSVFMAGTKCAVMTLTPTEMVGNYEAVRQKLLRLTPKRTPLKLTYFEQLPPEDRAYLRGWFSEQVLADLDQVAMTIEETANGPARDFMWLALSNILRKVSWQKEDDLRVRKEVRLDADIDAVREFLEELGRSVRLVLPFLYQSSGMTLGAFEVSENDARSIQSCWQRWVGKVDVVITSPPYATALPYLDTDRLSICYMRLLPRPEHRSRDQDMIGNREITEKRRATLWIEFQRKRAELPPSVRNLVERVEALNSRAQVGFRRRNLGALLAKYFIDMRKVFSGISTLLRPGSLAYVVVGNNHTVAGGKRVEIETAKLLADLAAREGFSLEMSVPMEMLVSRDIFRKNAVASEKILGLRKRT